MTGVDAGVSHDTLEAQRDFLLKSLEDLDAEYQVGDIDEADYRNLTDDYTARTAAVLRAIEVATAPRSRMAPPPGPSPSATDQRPLDRARAGRRRLRLAVLAPVFMLFGGGAVWALTSATGARGSGQTVTGNRQLQTSGRTPSTITGGIDPRFVQASDLVNQGKVTDALKLYDAILADDPRQPVALANDGWLLAQAGIAGKRPDLVNAGLVRIELAEKVDTNYPAAHFFRGFLLLRAKSDPAGAVTELRTYLGAVDPSAPEVPQVTKLLDEAIKAASPNVPAGPNAPTTTGAGPPAP